MVTESSEKIFACLARSSTERSRDPACKEASNPPHGAHKDSAARGWQYRLPQAKIVRSLCSRQKL
ncbi:hypothetical protein BDV34DRAFT_63601 [Aspergillus parasiticus]|uniref:Uncharacterized protein n=1 Tax=Aspergillus parasiticus TaxID=5067 RepID=A0A5N6E6L6_ASPPA|nr:hypothetical protein BDV34DRAFT_63601 [Aspergillus parasiticus]